LSDEEVLMDEKETAPAGENEGESEQNREVAISRNTLWDAPRMTHYFDFSPPMKVSVLHFLKLKLYFRSK
jgi:hypothetical protein